ncbi:hypothetical protein C8A00DRAFT_19089 [Chaetomidium leptoderma]|uniref:DUF6594 domain-containing protein n=1 Tax=Chaetomidium leptoderma TaxID=669021 RepID=A0AAN6VCZ3_9PEZI|nr:hypothetical protein C8A00DRAFT_19089 [Chaetomidium leptoderma]
MPRCESRAVSTSPRELQRPDPLSFLENDSPPVTEDTILQAIAQASGSWSPRSISSFGSVDSSRRSAAETDTTTPDQSDNGDISPPTTAAQSSSQLNENGPVPAGGQTTQRGSRARRPQLHPLLDDDGRGRYGTPEMARGSAKHPHFSPNELQPRLVAPGQGFPKHLPRAEKLPMTGYELLAAKLSTSDPWAARRGSSGTSDGVDGPSIKPIYRKFEALNHRLLLHLQDELSELEEQLHRLDTADTQTRRLQNCILPASRRAEFMAGGELQWRKTDMLGKIGFKLGQYNHTLDAFTKTLNLPSASMGDIEDYRTYLATHNPIAEIETRFLDPADDLAYLAPDSAAPSSRYYSTSRSSHSGGSDELLTPMPNKMAFGNRHSRSSSASHSRSSSLSSVTSAPPGLPRGMPTPSPLSDHQHLGRVSHIERHGVNVREEEDGASTATESNDSSLDKEAVPREQEAILLAFLAVVLPILMFPVTTDFLGRMAIVSVVGLVVSALRRNLAEAESRARLSGGKQEGPSSSNGWVVVAVYGAVMAVVAAIF